MVFQAAGVLNCPNSYLNSTIILFDVLYTYCYNPVGAICIAELIRTKHKLDVLSLSANNLGDDGIVAIAGALGKCNIDTLIIDECGINVTGAKALAESLLINKSITLLTLWDNPMTVEGARAIIESAVGNGTLCPCMMIDNHLYEEDDEAQLMIKVLQLRKRRQNLKVSIAFAFLLYCLTYMLMRHV